MKNEFKQIILEVKKAEKEVEKDKINRTEAKKLFEYIKKICEIGTDYEMVYSYLNPQGAEGRSFDEEINFYLTNRKKGINYSPEFIYPAIRILNSQKLKNVITELQFIEKRARKEKNKYLKNIVFEALIVLKAKINIFIELKNGNTKKAFEFAKDVYGDIDDDLIKEAEKWYKEKINFLEKRKKKSKLEISLEKRKFNAKDIKYYFDLALNESNLRENGIKVIIREGEDAINVNFNDFRYSHPVIIVPAKRKVNGVRLFELIAHEIGCHVLTNTYNIKAGLGSFGIGKKWDLVSEGLAIRNEVNIKKKMLGKSYSDFKIKSHAYPILAMGKIKEGFNIGQVYDYIFNLRKKEFLAMGYSGIKSKNEALAETNGLLKRVYRGFYPYYFPKDKAYFEGEYLARIIEKEKLDTYFFQFKVDIKFLPDIIKLGIYKNGSSKREIKRSHKIAEIIWNKNKKIY